MFNLNKFIGEHVTHRAESMFASDIAANSATLSAEIKDKKVCVIGGAAFRLYVVYQGGAAL